MAEFFTIQGHSVPLEVESGAEVEHPQDHVDRQRTFDMQLVEQERADAKRIWRATTCVLTPLEARAYRALITGDGSRVALAEDMLSSRGLGPKSGSNYTEMAGAGVDGEDIVYVAAGDTLSYAAGLGNRWTVIARLDPAAGGAPYRVALTSAGICFIDGAEATEAEETAARALLAVSAGDVVISGEVDVYGIQWWNEILTDDMLEDMTAADAVASELPFVEAGGSYLEHDTVTVRGVVLSEEEVVAVIEGTEYPNARRLSLELYEQEVEEVIAAPTISYSDVSATVGDPISVTPTITGDYDAIEVASGTLPDGAALNADGTITGAEYLTEQTVSVVIRISGPGGVSRHEVTFTVAAGAAIDPPPGTAALDYDFADIDGDDSLNAAYADLDPIPTIVDKGALGVDAVQAVSTAQPTLRVGAGFGGGDYASFDGGDYLATGAAAFAALSHPNTVAVIGNVGTAGIEVFVDGDDAGRRQQVYASSGPSYWMTAGTALNSGIAPTTDQWESLVAVFDSTTNSRLTVSGVDGTGGNAGAHTPQGLVIGARYDGGASWLTGGIQHVLVYDDATDAAPADIQSYWETRHSAAFPAAGAP